MKTTFALSLLSATLLAGCAVGPDYHMPKLSTPLAWMGLGGKTADAGEAKPEVVLNMAWWKAFNDPTMDQLMQQALTRNGDLKVAVARVQEARGARLTSIGNLLPEIDGSGVAQRGKSALQTRTTNSAEAQFDASWELDLFGGNRRAAEAEWARLGQAKAAEQAARVQLLAEVASTYLDVRQLQQQVDLTRRNLADQQETLRIAEAQNREGVASGLDVAQARALAASTAAQVPLAEAQLTSSMYALGVLVGAQPVEISATMASVTPVPVATPDVLVATPATVLAQRPDVRVAERSLAAATADQGVALANWFPRISLTGLFGLANTSALGTNGVWNAGGVVSLPLIDFGRVRGLVRQADARQVQALATYEQTVLGALADVESRLTGYVKAVERAGRLRTAAEASHKALDLAKLQYNEGVVAHLDVLVAEQQQLAADQAAAAGDAVVGQVLAGLYKAVGGGANVMPESAAR